MDQQFWSKDQSSSSSNVNKTVHVKQFKAAAITWTFYTTFTQLLIAYTDLHFIWWGSLLQKPLKVYSGEGWSRSKEFIFRVWAQDKLETWVMSVPEPSLAWKSNLLPSPSRAQLGYPSCLQTQADPGSDFEFITEPAQLRLIGSSCLEL